MVTKAKEAEAKLAAEEAEAAGLAKLEAEEAAELAKLEAEEAAAKLAAGPVVSKGYSFTCRRGLLKGGSPISKADFGDSEAFDKFVEAGHITVPKK